MFTRKVITPRIRPRVLRIQDVSVGAAASEALNERHGNQYQRTCSQAKDRIEAVWHDHGTQRACRPCGCRNSPSLHRMMNDRDAVHQNTAPTRNIAAVPATDRPFINQGPPTNAPAQRLREAAALGMQPQAQVIQLDDASYQAIHPQRRDERNAAENSQLLRKGAVATVPRVIAMIRQRMKSVRTRPLIFSFSKATMSTAGSELAFNRLSCSVSAA